MRAKQFETALGGNVSMQIWLGKQHLGQRDKTELEQSGTVTNIQVTVDTDKTAEELRRLINGSKAD